ncbi:hypothetical protein NMG60_11035499 [Bertholletia excelsa]
MARPGLACLVLAQILLVQAMTVRSGGSELKPFVTVRTGDETSGTGSVHSTHSIADPPSSGDSESSSEGSAAEAPEIRRLGRHNGSDKSVAGGGVIIGGLVTAIFAAIFCYIRVTRRRECEHH